MNAGESARRCSQYLYQVASVDSCVFSKSRYEGLHFIRKAWCTKDLVCISVIGSASPCCPSDPKSLLHPVYASENSYIKVPSLWIGRVETSWNTQWKFGQTGHSCALVLCPPQSFQGSCCWLAFERISETSLFLMKFQFLQVCSLFICSVKVGMRTRANCWGLLVLIFKQTAAVASGNVPGPVHQRGLFPGINIHCMPTTSCSQQQKQQLLTLPWAGCYCA